MMRSEFKTYLLANGAAQTSHSGRSLWEHLAGVHRILQASGAADYVCRAGLFHSVYGTRVFKKVTLKPSQRCEVRELIGEPAESLAWAFCNLPRPRLFEASLRQKAMDWPPGAVVSGDKNQFWQDLLRVECANLLEQRSLHQFPLLAQHAQTVRMLDREGFSV
jgi:hypothetical protein